MDPSSSTSGDNHFSNADFISSNVNLLNNLSNVLIEARNDVGGMARSWEWNQFIVDTGHVVAFDPSLDYTISGMGNFKSTMLSGEGLVMRFKGSGKLYLQTRNVSSVASWLTPRLLG